MVEKKKSGNGDVIERGHVFNEDGGSWEVLPEGYGVVVFRCSGKLEAYGCAWDVKDDQGVDSLAKNLAGAKFLYGDQAYLAIKENGNLVFLTEKPNQPSILPKAPAKIPDWMLEKRFRFGRVAANRR